jgi:predicted small secreted protein
VADFGREIKDLYFSTVGSHFGDGYDFLSPFLVIVYSAVALTVSLSDVRYKPFAKSGIALFLIALVFLLLTLTFAGFVNSVSEGAGEDIKYGYGIPILFSLLAILNIKAVKVDMNVVNHFVLPFTAFMEMLAIYSAVSQIA